jgi:subtilisin-like proprotein convertase family protein
MDGNHSKGLRKSIAAGGLAILFLQTFAFGVIYSSFGSAVGKSFGSAIQNDVVVETQLYVPISGIIKDFNLSLNLQHTSFCDLSIVIQSPSGKSVTVSNYDKYTFKNKQVNGWITLDNESLLTIDQVLNLSIGSFKPTGSKPLSAFYNAESSGMWKIKICDHIYEDTGTWYGVRFDLAIEPQVRQTVLSIPEPSTLIISIGGLIFLLKKR